jgi:SprT protein
VKDILPHQAVPFDLVLAAEANVIKNLDKANNHFNLNLSCVGVKFFRKSKTAGYVIPGRDNIVYLNIDLFKANFAHFINDTIPHEVAHLFAHHFNTKLKKKEGIHGSTWKTIMSKIYGINAKRCHELDLSGIDLPKSKFKYICLCKKHLVGDIIHNKIEKGSRYECQKCKSSLTFLSKND